jgi:hypothetical protein
VHGYGPVKGREMSGRLLATTTPPALFETIVDLKLFFVSVDELKGALGSCSGFVDEGGTTRKRLRGKSATRFRLSSGQRYGK